MDTFKRLAVVVTVFYLVFGFNSIWCAESNGAEKTREKLPQTRYVDPKGYFKITPPQGWRILKYPKDPRGKVAFIGAKNVDLRVLARAADFDSFEGLLKLVRDIEKRAGINTNIQKISFLGRTAVKRNFVFKGFKLLQIDFMEGNIKHNLQYCAPPGVYDKYLAIATKSMNTYETILRAVSAQDVQKHALAQNLRLARLFFEKGDLNLASEFVREGLKIMPQNADLLKLKRQIEGEGTPVFAEGTKRSDEGKDRLETVRVIRVVVEQAYGEAGGVKLPFYDISKKFLEGGGFTVVGSEAKKFDGMLNIKAKGTPIGKKYGKDQYLYTGAEIKGDLQFLIDDSVLYSKGFECRQDPPWMFHIWGKKEEREKKINNLKKPANAPFSNVFEKNVHLHLGDMIYTLWGIEVLAASLNAKKTWHIRERIIEVLGRTKDPKAIKPLVYYTGGGTNVGFKISRALLQIEDRATVCKTLIAALKDENFRVREHAAEALGDIKGKGAVEPLIGALNDNVSRVRSNAAEALGEIKDPRAVEPLINTLKDKDAWVRRGAAEALGGINDSRAVEPLIAALKDKDAWVRWKSAEALGKIEDIRAVEPLIVTLKDDDSFTRSKGEEALRKITGQKLGKDQTRWQKWWQENKATFRNLKRQSQ